MCDEKKAIDNLFTMLRGEPYSRPHAIYAHSIDGDELVGFAAFVEDVLTFFRVDSDESVHCDGLVSHPAMGARGIAAKYDADYAIAI